MNFLTNWIISCSYSTEIASEIQTRYWNSYFGLKGFLHYNSYMVYHDQRILGKHMLLNNRKRKELGVQKYLDYSLGSTKIVILGKWHFRFSFITCKMEKIISTLWSSNEDERGWKCICRLTNIKLYQWVETVLHSSFFNLFQCLMHYLIWNYHSISGSWLEMKGNTFLIIRQPFFLTESRKFFLWKTVWLKVRKYISTDYLQIQI